jgi:hypothetical protein
MIISSGFTLVGIGNFNFFVRPRALHDKCEGKYFASILKVPSASVVVVFCGALSATILTPQLETSFYFSFKKYLIKAK